MSEPRAAESRHLPGPHTACALLTLLTILLAWPDPPHVISTVTLPAYFALLAWFFASAARRHRALQGQPMRLVRAGFVVLFVAFTTSAVVTTSGLAQRLAAFAYLDEACRHGALFLLGITLVAYGMMLWIPRLVAAHEVLAVDLDHRTTELRAAEHQLVEADRRALIGALAAGVAHDLRNPLTIVLATAESLCRRPRSAAEIADHTEVIRRNVHKANETLTALLELGRPRTSHPEPLPARAVVADVLALVQVEARRHEVQFTVLEATSGPVELFADRALVAQALLNLVLNAVHASPPGATITVRMRSCGTASVIAVEDRGNGVAAPRRMPDFEPFHTTKTGGTGLGLWSCRRIAEQLGGRLALYPRHRGGVRVALRLPATAAPEPATATAPVRDTRRTPCPTAVY